LLGCCQKLHYWKEQTLREWSVSPSTWDIK
jgi:hypothetical protein